jgi:hypothetical protein
MGLQLVILLLLPPNQFKGCILSAAGQKPVLAIKAEIPSLSPLFLQMFIKWLFYHTHTPQIYSCGVHKYL